MIHEISVVEWTNNVSVRLLKIFDYFYDAWPLIIIRRRSYLSEKEDDIYHQGQERLTKYHEDDEGDAD